MRPESDPRPTRGPRGFGLFPLDEENQADNLDNKNDIETEIPDLEATDGIHDPPEEGQARTTIKIGTLTVLVDRARNLPNERAPDTQAPYCKVQLYNVTRRTVNDALGGGSPLWYTSKFYFMLDAMQRANAKQGRRS